MKLISSVIMVAWFLVVCSPSSAQIVAGNDDLTGAGGPDAWTNILYINEDNPFSGDGVLTYTNFWAASGRNGLYTPFVAEPMVANPEFGDDFVIRAIGTTREAGVDFTCTGEFRFPFHDAETFNVDAGWVAGFLSSDPAGERDDARSPIPFVGNAGIEGWLTGSGGPATGLPAIEIGEAIVEGGSGTDVDAFGFRQYDFNISAVTGDVKPPLDPGGRVGEACEPPPPPVENQIGAPLPLTTGIPDSWSGVPVMYGHSLPPGESVEVVRYYAHEDREFDVEDGLYNVVPLIVRQEDGSVESGEGIFSIWEIGPTHQPTEVGENEFAWSSSPIPDDDNLYHPAALQWLLDADNGAGGVVAFADGEGEGMHYFDVDTSFFVPDEDIGELEPDFVLSDLTIHSSGFGGRGYQLNFEVGGAEPGDFNGDGKLDHLDINELSMQIRDGGMQSKYDLNDDGMIDLVDHGVWVKDLKNTWIGDANLDGEFSSADLVTVFAAGKYELQEPANWEEGDWDADALFDSSDLVAAFSDGGYELGPRPPNGNAIPEPSCGLMLALGLGLGMLGRRGRRR